MQEIHERVGGAHTIKRSPSDAISPPWSLLSLTLYLQGIVRTLRQSDAQLFAGWGSYPSISDTAMLEKVDRLASKAATLLKVAAISLIRINNRLLNFPVGKPQWCQ